MTRKYLSLACTVILFLPLLTACKKSSSGERIPALEITDIMLGTGNAPKTGFKTDDTIQVSFDVKNIVAMRAGGEQYFWIRQDVSVVDSRGAIVLVQPAVLDIKSLVAKKPAKFINELSLKSVQDLKPGQYAMLLLVSDLVGFQTTVKRVPFTII